MPNGKDALPEVLASIPWWRKGDPGPDWPWIMEEISQESRVALVVSQLQYEKEVVAAQSAAIDRNIAILKAAGANAAKAAQK
jgi:hypothetical protein